MNSARLMARTGCVSVPSYFKKHLFSLQCVPSVEDRVLRAAKARDVFSIHAANGRNVVSNSAASAAASAAPQWEPLMRNLRRRLSKLEEEDLGPTRASHGGTCVAYALFAAVAPIQPRIRHCCCRSCESDALTLMWCADDTRDCTLITVWGVATTTYQPRTTRQSPDQ